MKWQAGTTQTDGWSEGELFPAYCDQCDEITPVNYAADAPKCVHCKIANFRHIDDPSISAGDGQQTVYAWFGAKKDGSRSIKITWPTFTGKKLSIRQKLSQSFLGYYTVQVPNRVQHQITDGHYLCPKCKTYNLKLVKDTP
jgi:Zn finger protein HypA/HybF involved in hydrogenase expression